MKRVDETVVNVTSRPQLRVMFTPRVNPVSGEPDGYDFEGPTRFDKLFTGIAVERPKSLDSNDLSGTEDIGPEDTSQSPTPCVPSHRPCSTRRYH